MNGKTVVKIVEITSEKFKEMSSMQCIQYIEKRMLEEKFDSNKKTYKYIDLDKQNVVYEQRKYIIPKRKKV